MFWLYRLLALLISPLLGWRLQRVESDPARRREGQRQRRGHVDPAGQDPIWIHAASVGEVNAIQGLADAILRRHPDIPLVISTFTVSGAAQVQRVFADRVHHRYLPQDTARATSRWLKRLSPRLALIAETEIWPELFHQANRRGLDLVLINARLSARGLQRSLRFRPLFARALQTVEAALCQSPIDADRLIELGLPPARARVTGNLKFDTPRSADVLTQARAFRDQWGEKRVWVAGSTRPGEEETLLDAHVKLLRTHDDVLLVLAPRHPERASTVDDLIRASGLIGQRLGETIGPETQVVLVDRIGALQSCYAAGAVAFVGGSLVDIGGHNLLEPAALGKPVVTGPHLDNQREMRDALVTAQALTLVEGSDDLAETISDWLSNPERALARGRSALSVVEEGRGSVKRTLTGLASWLEQARPASEPGLINAATD